MLNAAPTSDGRAPCVFVVHDHMLEPLFAGIVNDLERNGVGIVRGPLSQPSDKPNALPLSFMEQMQQADIAMFSSRSLCTAEMMAACATRLRAVVNPTIGVETVDLAAANKQGILVGNGATPENYIGMAEAAIMFMLNLFYGLRTTEQHLRENRPRPTPDEVHARTLRGKTIGILGLGNIGRSVARLLQPFDVNVLAYSPHVDASMVPVGVKVAGLDDLMARSDLVCICIAVTPQNRQLVNDRTLGLMKRSAYLVNVARGDAIDEQALVRVLQEGRIAGAALDTFAKEPLPMDSPLRSLKNVILTPHAVGYTKENVDSLRFAAVENIRRVLAGLPPLYCKNPDMVEKWSTRVAGMERLRSWPATIQP